MEDLSVKIDLINIDGGNVKDRKTAQPPPRFGFNNIIGDKGETTYGFFNANMGENDVEKFENGSSIVMEKYTHDLNILKIHNKVLEYLKYQERRKLEQYENELIEEKKKLAQNQTINERKLTLLTLTEYENKIQEYKDGKAYQEYCKKSHDLITAYQKIGPLPHVVSFINKTQGIESVINDQDQLYRHSIIGQYLDIAKQFAPIDIIRESEMVDICTECNAVNDKIVDECYGRIICKSCGYERQLLKQTYYQDNINIGTAKNNYQDRSNFYKALLRFQGLQPNKLPKNLFTDLDDYFISKNLPTADEILKCSINKYGEREGTTRNLMYKALGDTKHSNLYEDINLILAEYWGWKLPNISHLEEQIMADYDLTQTIYEEIPKQRKSCLNIQFRLYKHLIRYTDYIDIPIRIQDFKIPTTREIIEVHEDIWSKICTLLYQKGYLDWKPSFQ